MREYDVVVIGGGAAGLSAALVLARARRCVVVVDAGAPRNAPAARMHGFLSRDGCPPRDLLAAGRAEVAGYGGHLVSGRVDRIARRAVGFDVRLPGRPSLTARRVLVTTGLHDELPDIPGVRERWGLAMVLLLTLVLLTRAFRSVVLAVKAVALNLFSLGAALGIVVVVFQQGHGSRLWDVGATGSTTAYVPLMTFAFLFGLSMDYEVFMLSRMREAYDETGSTDRAIELGLARTGKLVTSGALILMFAFLVLSSSPGFEIKSLAVGIAAGIIFDATVIRALLVPALMKLFGAANWWTPTWLDRLLPTPQDDARAPLLRPERFWRWRSGADVGRQVLAGEGGTRGDEVGR